MTSNPRDLHTSAAALAGRAVVPGTVFAVVAGVATVASGGLPDGTAPYVAVGCAAAAITGALGAAFKARAVAGDVSASGGSSMRASQGLQLAILGDFVLQLFVIGGAMLGMYLSGVTFDSLVGFALAFAAVAVGHQVGSSLVLARALRRRAALQSARRAAESPSAAAAVSQGDGRSDAPAVSFERRGVAPIGPVSNSSGTSRR